MSELEGQRDWFVPAQPSYTPIFDQLAGEMSLLSQSVREVYVGELWVKEEEQQ